MDSLVVQMYRLIQNMNLMLLPVHSMEQRTGRMDTLTQERTAKSIGELLIKIAFGKELLYIDMVKHTLRSMAVRGNRYLWRN